MTSFLIRSMMVRIKCKDIHHHIYWVKGIEIYYVLLFKHFLIFSLMLIIEF